MNSNQRRKATRELFETWRSMAKDEQETALVDMAKELSKVSKERDRLAERLSVLERRHGTQGVTRSAEVDYFEGLT
jgi:ubiquinone biosynthesis protein UbiJ